MAIIGKFTRQKNGIFVGSIKTLTTDLVAAFEPVSRKNKKAPDYRLMADGFNLGAAWERTTGNGGSYLSVLLDDPSFAAPAHCRLVKTRVEHDYSLIWERDRKRS
jgi:uncharacterized protein (DUF736 family)